MEIHEYPEGLAHKKRVPENIEDMEPIGSLKKLRIPRKRIDVVKQFKDKIEEKGKVKLEITDEISIIGDPFNVFATSTVITAIGRGFDYRVAASLFDDSLLYVIPISKNQKTLTRIRSRLIGRNGTARKKIEHYTKTRIAVYGKTVSIIGRDENLEAARTAVERLIEGKPHTIVFKFLEAKNKG
jgi:ribosomal RNA assembly protein